MKFCPKCGTKLEDDAVFCSSCGERQPGAAPAPVEASPEVSPAVSVPPVASAAATPAERFRTLMATDEDFAKIVKTTRKANLLFLVNLLYWVPLLVCLLTPVAMFTGNEVSTTGMAEINALGWTFPIPFSALSILEFKAMAGKSSLGPYFSFGPLPITSLVLGGLMVPLSVLVAVLGSPKGYMLRTYEAGKKTELLKGARSIKIFFGPALALLGLSSALATFITCNDVKYVYEDSSRYIYGEVASMPEGLIPCIVVTSIFIAIMIAVYCVLRFFVLKPIRGMK